MYYIYISQLFSFILPNIQLFFTQIFPTHIG